MPFIVSVAPALTWWGVLTFLYTNPRRPRSLPRKFSQGRHLASNTALVLFTTSHPIMRFITFASLCFSVLFVSAQTSKRDAASLNELLAQLSALPKCVVRITIQSRIDWKQLTSFETTCVTEALPESKCTLGDLACLCSDTKYAASSEKCILANCTVKEGLRKFDPRKASSIRSH